MKIHGKKILDFPCGNIVKEQQTCDFDICDDEHSFVIEVDDYPIQEALGLCNNNCSVHREYMYCMDENNEAFTLYDCFISPIQIPVRQVKVIWNKCLYGHHIADIHTYTYKNADS